MREAALKGGKNVAYQFLDRAGDVVTGSTGVTRSEIPGLRQTVTLLYDQQNPRRNTLHPAQLAEISTDR